VKTVFSTFNFKTSDLATEERLYIENHVRLARQLPNLRQYMTGLVRPHPDRPSPHRAAFLYFDDLEALKDAMHRSPVAKQLLEDGAAHLRVNRWLELDTEIVVPFESRRPGLQCFIMTAEIDLRPKGIDVAAPERRYVDHYTQLASQLPNLRHYMVGKYRIAGKLVGATGTKPELAPMRDPLRVAVLVFDSVQALREAYRSPAGKELAKDEEIALANARIYYIDGTVQV